MASDRPPEPDHDRDSESEHDHDYQQNPDPDRRIEADPEYRVDSGVRSSGDSATGINAIIGGVVSIVLSFIPLSTVIGGAVSGYLEGGTPEDGLKVGAISGALVFIPFALLGLFGLALLGVIGAPTAFGVIGLFVLVFSAIYTIGLSALGGYLGVYVKRER
jgi:hypothetical protein